MTSPLLQVWLGNASALGWAALCAFAVVMTIRWATVTKISVRMQSGDDDRERETGSPLLSIQNDTSDIYE
jgi:hypothetical protein